MAQYPAPTRVLGGHEEALDRLKPLVKVPCFLCTHWLARDPNFTPLRGSARFEKLLKKTG